MYLAMLQTRVKQCAFFLLWFSTRIDGFIVLPNQYHPPARHIALRMVATEDDAFESSNSNQMPEMDSNFEMARGIKERSSKNGDWPLIR